MINKTTEPFFAYTKYFENEKINYIKQTEKKIKLIGLSIFGSHINSKFK